MAKADEEEVFMPREPGPADRGERGSWRLRSMVLAAAGICTVAGVAALVALQRASNPAAAPGWEQASLNALPHGGDDLDALQNKLVIHCMLPARTQTCTEMMQSLMDDGTESMGPGAGLDCERAREILYQRFPICACCSDFCEPMPVTEAPTDAPTAAPTAGATPTPTEAPTAAPSTPAPTETPEPTPAPTVSSDSSSDVALARRRLSMPVVCDATCGLISCADRFWQIKTSGAIVTDEEAAAALLNECLQCTTCGAEFCGLSR